jgi:DNA-binding NtrC family response regulator
MSSAVALLISGDPSLVTSVQQAVDAVPHLCMEVADAFDSCNLHLYRSDLGLIILHLGRRKTDADELSRILDLGNFQRRGVAAIVVSDQPDSELELKLAQQGAADFLERPLNVRRLAYLADLRTVRIREGVSHGGTGQGDAVISLGESEPFLFAPATQMGRVMEKVFRVAPQDTTILLTGETGTGKSRLARLIHEMSPRRSQPFQVINCGALSANLVESEIFGHVKGAFTGADRNRIGKCAEVGRGTLVLDEVDTLSLDMQAKLLRVVEDRTFEAVGSNSVLALEGRLIVATNRNLRDEVAARRFRADLFYRLNVVEFGLFPLRELLRENPDALMPFLQHFLLFYSEKFGHKFQGFHPDAMRALQGYAWPGNIREVRNVIERAVALSAGPLIVLDDLPTYLVENALPSAPATAPVEELTIESTLNEARHKAERLRIIQALAKFPKNRDRAAMELGISRMTLYNKLRRYGL